MRGERRGGDQKLGAENKRGPCRHKAQGSTPGLRPQIASELAELGGLMSRFTAEQAAQAAQPRDLPLTHYRRFWPVV